DDEASRGRELLQAVLDRNSRQRGRAFVERHPRGFARSQRGRGVQRLVAAAHRQVDVDGADREVAAPARGGAVGADAEVTGFSAISSTSALWFGSSRRVDSGTPVSVFRLPVLCSVSNFVESTAAVISLVDVLPLLPVTPTTSGLTRESTSAATSYSAFHVSGTTISTMPEGASRRRSTTTAAAPRAIAS